MSNGSNSHLKRHYNLVVFELKCHIGEVVVVLVISTKPPLINGILRCMTREAGPAGPNIREGGAWAAGITGQSSRAAYLVARKVGPTG